MLWHAIATYPHCLAAAAACLQRCVSGRESQRVTDGQAGGPAGRHTPEGVLVASDAVAVDAGIAVMKASVAFPVSETDADSVLATAEEDAAVALVATVASAADEDVAVSPRDVDVGSGTESGCGHTGVRMDDEIPPHHAGAGAGAGEAATE
jgi:hypothetical protein